MRNNDTDHVFADMKHHRTFYSSLSYLLCFLLVPRTALLEGAEASVTGMADGVLPWLATSRPLVMERHKAKGLGAMALWLLDVGAL